VSGKALLEMQASIASQVTLGKLVALDWFSAGRYQFKKDNNGPTWGARGKR
jgi:hypothetical protein